MENITPSTHTQLQLISLPNRRRQRSYFQDLLELLRVDDTRPGWPDSFGKELRDYVARKRGTPIRTLSLFTGGGGLDIAFHDAGFKIMEMVEFDPRFVETLAANTKRKGRLSGAKPLCMDIRAFQPAPGAKIDFIIGGPPCQTFSAAGRRAAGVAGLDDPRGVLFKEYVRILERLRPRGFLFENVYGIVGAQGGKAWQKIVQAFESAGYTVSWRILDAADYGVPQHRERLVIVGIEKSRTPFWFPRPTHGPDSPDGRLYYRAGLAIEGVDDEKPGPVGGRYGHLLRDIPPGLNYSFYTEEMEHPQPVFAWRSKFSDFLYKADPEMPVRTIKAQGGLYTGPFHWSNRPFSSAELKRLQTFPDDYVLVGGTTSVIHQLGNAVPPQLGRILAIGILQQVFGLNFPFDISLLWPGEPLGFRARKRALHELYGDRARTAIRQNGETASKSGGHKKEAEVMNEGTAYLGPDFQWCVQGNCEHGGRHEWNVRFRMSREDGLVDIHVDTPKASAHKDALVVDVKPTGDWRVPAHKVRLRIGSLAPTLVTAAWKAFEYWLMKKGIKADLVQLNGYYQYIPELRIKVESSREPAPNIEWRGLLNALQGVGVRRTVPLEYLADLWEASVEETRRTLVWLRSLGYEVRSEHTNGQIPKGHILIPYAFPTLNPKSVQLRKQLFPNATK